VGRGNIETTSENIHNLKTMPEEIKCVLCGDSRTRVLHTIRPRQPFKEDSIAALLPERIWNICLDCGLIYLSPRLTSGEAALLYDEDYHDMHHEELRGWEFHKKKTLLEKYARGGRLLDVGCGYGYFQNSLGKNWTPVGVEPSEAACRGGRERLGADISCGTISLPDFMPESFDAVTLWDVLEHLPDPVAELKLARALLRPGGALGISTCDASALVPRAAGKFWYCINTPDHQFGFTLPWLRLALDRAGFEFKEVIYHNSGLGFFLPFIKRLAVEAAKSALGAAVRILRHKSLAAKLAKKAPPLVPMFHDLVIIVAIKR
jgi:2-polyprenyl-3-methyl-5-hydroxy-6-metoxy-1,4-benzoquinol methylase